MSDQRNVLVVGAGLIGASIAWHLQSSGARVTVVAPDRTGGVATPNSFAWINASWGNPEPYFRLRIRAMAEWRRLAAAVPAIPLAWSGGLSWDLPGPELEAFAHEHGGWGYGMRRVDRAEALEIEPNLRHPPEFAFHVAQEGAIEPAETALALLADAERLGAHLQFGATVTRLASRSGRVVGVETSGGLLQADDVVLAAGAETAALAATAEVVVPMSAPSGLLVHSRPHAPLLNGLVLAPELHMRQTREGRIVAGSDYGGADPGLDPQAAADALFAKVREMLRGAENLALDFHTLGYRPTPADGFPIVGRPDGTDGLYIAVTHSGVTLAAAIGLMAAEEILAGRRDPLLAPYSPARFG